MAQLLGLLLAFAKLGDLLVQLSRKRHKMKDDAGAIVTLQNYRERLEKALLARRKAALDDIDHNRDRADGLPDDGHRRD